VDSMLWTALALSAPLLALAAGSASGSPAPPSVDPPASAGFDLRTLERELAGADERYLPFFDSRSLRLGLYALPAGAFDGQPVHEDDEIYYVVRGRAVLRAADELIPVEPGSIAFVRAGVEHRFIDIEEDLEVLVIFGETPKDGPSPASGREPDGSSSP